MNEIKVNVIDKGRKYLYMRFRCPETGVEETRSTGVTSRREAERIAGKWEADLREGRYQRSARMPWELFREAYEDATFPTMDPESARTYAISLDHFERACRPQRVGDLTTTRITKFAAELRKEQSRKLRDGSVKRYHLSEATIAGRLRNLKTVARWAHSQGMLPTVPHFAKQRQASGAQRMKGRPISPQEFDWLLAAVPSVVGDEAAPSWKFFLEGLWWSGLRLSEALALRWDHQRGGVSVRLSGRQSVLVFDAEAQKNGKSQVVPAAPEFVQLLEPERRDRGLVFPLLSGSGLGLRGRSRQNVGDIVVAIGRAAGVVTNVDTGKTCSAHDLRRSFGYRWSRRVMPPVLKVLMRHSDISTTLRYYVGDDAITTAGELWAVLGDTSGDTRAGAAERGPEKAANIGVWNPSLPHAV